MPAKLKAWMASARRRLEARNRHGKPVYTVVLGVIILLVTLVIAFVNPYQQSMASLLMFSVAIVSLLMGVYAGLPVAWAMNTGIAVAMMHLVHVCSAAGGIHSPRLVWLFLVPVAAFYSLGLRMGQFWLGVSLLVAVGMALGTENWMAQSMFHFGPDYATASLLSYVLATVVMMSVPWLYDRMNERQLRLSQQRLRQLQAKQVELEHTVQMREHFIATVSHELRTPMNAILGLNALLLERVQGKPQAQKVLEYTRQSADHLMTVINDVLDYSQLSSGKLKAQPQVFELAVTVRAAFELFRPQVENTDLVYTCEVDAAVPRWVNTDRHRLMQVLVNLLGNAIKFTHQGSVRLQVQVQNQGVVFVVQDTGIGMNAQQQQRIFQRFRQADESIQSQYGGSGLGLTITQELVQMLGGHLALHSQEGVGSRFECWLPLLEVAPRTEAPSSAPGANASETARERRFLVVDDHPVNRLLLRQALLRQWPGCVVDECENGAQALQHLQSARYDLVLMDMVMPEMDGIEATRAIRDSADAQARRTPVLGLTANVNAQDQERFEQAGLDGLMLKPFEMAQLRDEIERLVLHARR